MTVYGIYDTKDKDVCIGVFNIYELVEYTNMTRGSIYSMVNKKCLWKHRYRILSLGKMENEEND